MLLVPFVEYIYISQYYLIVIFLQKVRDFQVSLSDRLPKKRYFAMQKSETLTNN